MGLSPDRININHLKRPVLIQDIPSDTRSPGMIERVKEGSVTIRKLSGPESVFKVEADLLENGFVERGSTRVFLLPLAQLPEAVRGLLRTTQ